MRGRSSVMGLSAGTAAALFLSSVASLAGDAPSEGPQAQAEGPAESTTPKEPAAGGGARERRLGPKELDEFLASLEEKLSSMRTLETQFVQEKHLAMFSDVVISRGVLAFARPDRLRWEITEPFRSLLVVNGERLAKFDFPEGRPRKLKPGGEDAIRAVTRQLSLWHQGRFREHAGSYDIEVRGDRRRIVLIPQSRRVRGAVRAIEMHFSEDLSRISSVTIREGGGDHTMIRFLEEKRDAELPEWMFDVEDPVPRRSRLEGAAGER